MEDEHIVPHGSAETTWWVRVNESWAAAATLGEVTSLDPGPGTVWRRRVELRLAGGTRLLRVESRPLIQHKTPLEFLARQPTTARKLRRVEFVVGRGGEPVPALQKSRPKRSL
jgi:hypothetical protein